MDKKIILYTIADKRPDFIEIQHDSIKHFCKDEYEYIVLNNGSSYELRNSIEKITNDRGIKCMVPQRTDFRDHTYAATIPLMWLWEEVISKDKENVSVIIDSDMFLLADTNFNKILDGHDIAFVPQCRNHYIKYFWNGIFIADAAKLPEPETMNWFCGRVDNVPVDTGGQTYHWLKKHHKNLSLKVIQHTWDIHHERPNIHCLPEEIKQKYKNGFDMQIYEKTILHYKRGSFWNTAESMEYHNQKSALLHELVYGAINNNLKLIDNFYDWKEPHEGLMDYWEVFDNE